MGGHGPPRSQVAPPLGLAGGARCGPSFLVGLEVVLD